MATLEPIRYTRGSLQLLDQLKLPRTTEYVPILSVESTFEAIATMKVRGAPAIAVSALLGLAAELPSKIAALQAGEFPAGYGSVQEAADTLVKKLDYLETSRPTAVNLHNAVVASKAMLGQKAPEFSGKEGKEGVCGLLEAYIALAEAALAKDTEDNAGIGKAGADYIVEKYGKGGKVQMLTHCNTGALATTKYGTALGVIRFIQAKGLLERVYCTETRPYNQGARLTAYECVHEKMDTTLICDSAVSHLMSISPPTAAVVGADRVCRNGDTANKIGTYQIALAAKHHGVPFFVAAPITTLDLELTQGKDINIEQRSPKEVTHNPETGNRAVVEGDNLTVWNPAFDVTPGSLIAGIITEVGVALPREDGTYDLREFVEAHRPSQ